MAALGRRVLVVTCMIGLAACGFPQLSELPGDAPIGGVPFQSCAALSASCGAGDSCCRSLVVPGGSYQRGYDQGMDGLFTSDSYHATISSFSLDKYEVTVGRFRAFVQAGMGTRATAPSAGAGVHPQLPGSGWEAAWNTTLPRTTADLEAAVQCEADLATWTDEPMANERRPMSCITWFEAMAFCIWDGGYLPTEAEWAYVATGGDQQRAYPWSTLDNELAISDMDASYQTEDVGCLSDGDPSCALADVLEVGTRPAGDGRWGHSELGGNVYEWVLDWFEEGYPAECTDCANLDETTGRAQRGGGFRDVEHDARAHFRDNAPPSARAANVGVRCARTP